MAESQKSKMVQTRVDGMGSICHAPSKGIALCIWDMF